MTSYIVMEICQQLGAIVRFHIASKLHLENAFEVSSKTSINLEEIFSLITVSSLCELWIHITAFRFCVMILACDCNDALYHTVQRLALVLQKSHIMPYCHQILSWQFVSNHFSLFLPQLLSLHPIFYPSDKFLQLRLNSHSLLVTEFLGVKHNPFYFSVCAIPPLVVRLVIQGSLIQNVICCRALYNRAVDLTTLLFLRWWIVTFGATRMGLLSILVWYRVIIFSRCFTLLLFLFLLLLN